MILVLPTGFSSDQYDEFRFAFDQLVATFSSVPSEALYSNRFKNQIIFSAYWQPTADYQAKVLSDGSSRRFLSLKPDAVKNSVQKFFEDPGFQKHPSSVVVLFNDNTELVTANTVNGRDLSAYYGITKLNLKHIESAYVTTHEIAHSLLNWADEYVEHGFEDLSINSTEVFTPFLKLGDEWDTELRNHSDLLGAYDIRLSEILADNGADNLSTTQHPGRVGQLEHRVSVDMTTEGGLYFSKGVYRSPQNNLMAAAPGFAFAHSESQEQTLQAAFNFLPSRANDRIRVAGPVSDTERPVGHFAKLLLFDADKYNRFHPTQSYTIEMGWYERQYKTCWNGPIPYPCYDDVWTTKQKVVSPSARTVSLNLGIAADGGPGLFLLSALCEGGIQNEIDPCEIFLNSSKYNGNSQGLTVHFKVPYQEVSVELPNMMTQYWWKFRTDNGTYSSNYTAWASVYRAQF